MNWNNFKDQDSYTWTSEVFGAITVDINRAARRGDTEEDLPTGLTCGSAEYSQDYFEAYGYNPRGVIVICTALYPDEAVNALYAQLSLELACVDMEKALKN